jgi:hypothetical protein
MLGQAVMTIPGAAKIIPQIVPKTAEGKDPFYGVIGCILSRGFANAKFPYRDWMDGVLAIDKIHIPKDGKPNLAYFMGQLRDESYKCRVFRLEREYEEAKNKPTHGDVTNEHMEALLAQCGIRRGSRARTTEEHRG